MVAKDYVLFWLYGYEPISINTIFSGMNIHFNPIIFRGSPGTRVLTHPHIFTAKGIILHGAWADPIEVRGIDTPTGEQSEADRRKARSIREGVFKKEVLYLDGPWS